MITYRGRDPFTHRPVAITTISLDDPGMDDSLLTRLETEARTASRLHHRGICSVIEFGRDEVCFFVVTEQTGGRSLDQIIEGDYDLDLSRRIDLIIQLARALAHAHETGVIHRDLKPSRIVVAGGVSARIVGFGLSALNAPGETDEADGRSVAYYSPERFNDEAGEKDDIFALGTIAWELLTGERAFPGEHRSEVMMQILSAEPPRPSAVANVPAELDRIILRCIARVPEDRYESPLRFAEELEAAFASLSRSERSVSRQSDDDQRAQELQRNHGGFNGHEEPDLSAEEAILHEKNLVADLSNTDRNVIGDSSVPSKPRQTTVLFLIVVAVAVIVSGILLTDDPDRIDRTASAQVSAPIESEIRQFIQSVEHAYEMKNASFFRETAPGFDPGFEEQVSTSTKESAEFSVDSIEQVDSNRFYVYVTEDVLDSTGNTVDSSMRYRYELRNSDDQWQLVSRTPARPPAS